MKSPRFLTSPLAATAGVLAGMAMLALPLRQLTSATPPPTSPAAATPASHTTPAWLTLKLLAPAKSVRLETSNGNALWELADAPAGNADTRLDLPLDHGGIDLTLTADFGDHPAETACFLTIAPDGLEEQTLHAIGSGRLENTLNFSWTAH